MRTGRPKLKNAEKKGRITGVRLRADERKLVEKAAAGQKKNLSEWIRATLLDGAQKQA